MMKKLGADLDCHYIKNVRNAQAHLKVIKNANGDNIDWKYIEELVNLQSKEQLHSGNK